MKMQFKRRFIILLATMLVVTGISALLNRASFDPNFSVVDALSSASKRARRNVSEESDTTTSWGYLTEDLALSNDISCLEESVDTGKGSYLLLRKAVLPKGTLRILSDQNNADYNTAVQEVAKYYESQGYTIDVKEYSETMMLSLAHAGHFDLFLLREEMP